MSLFEAAWDSISKAPIYNEHGEVIPYDVIYSGGDEDDDVRYATADFDTALAYALFGSAVGDLPTHIEGGVPGGHLIDMDRNRVPLRQTRPAIWRTRNVPDQDFYVMSDQGGNKDSFIFDEMQEPQEQLSDEEVEAKINAALERMMADYGEDEPIDYGPSTIETSADTYFPEEQVAHMRDAIKRLRGELPYRDVLTAEMMPHLATAWRDQLQRELEEAAENHDVAGYFRTLKQPYEREAANILMRKWGWIGPEESLE